MFGRKTRDLIVETVTIVRGLKKDFTRHVDNEDDKIDRLYDAIKECHGDCPESDHISEQASTLGRMELKYDEFFKEHGDVKAAVKAMADKKKTIKDLLKQAGMIIATIGVVTGIVLGILRYQSSKKPSVDTVKIEKMLEKLIDKD
jgi:hypothetical protein